MATKGLNSVLFEGYAVTLFVDKEAGTSAWFQDPEGIIEIQAWFKSAVSESDRKAIDSRKIVRMVGRLIESLDGSGEVAISVEHFKVQP